MDSKPREVETDTGGWRRRESEAASLPKRGFRDRWFLAAGSVFFLALIAGGVFLYRSRLPKPAPAPVAAPAPPPEPVAAAPSELNYAGILQANNVLQVPAPIEGVLEGLTTEAGQEVEEGQPLARIRNDTLETARQAAQEDLERVQSRINNLENALVAARLESSRAAADSDRARAEFGRAEKAALRQRMLLKEGATPRLTAEKAEKDYENAKTEYEAVQQLSRQTQDRVADHTRELEAARRQLEEKNKAFEAAKADLDEAEVKAPASGMLIAVKVKAGEDVNPTMKDLFTIAVEPTELHVPFEPDPKDEAKVKEGLEAQVQIVEYSGEPIVGKVARTEEGKWRAEFISPDPLIKPGLNANVKIKLPLE